MPQLNQAFSSRTPGEIILFGFDYSTNLQSGETIQSAIGTCTIEQGTDVNAAGRVSGGAIISNGNQFVSQLIDFATLSGCVPNNVYKIQIAATTSLGQVIYGWGNVAIVAAT